MNTFDAIKNRRSVKYFDPQHVLSADEEQIIWESVVLSPTSFNVQNWRFVCVKNPQLRKQLREVSADQAQVTDASLLIILCADLKAWEKEPQRYWRNTPQPVQNIILPAIDTFYRDNDHYQRDEAMRSCGIAAQTLMLSAKALGYDSCPMVGFDPVKVAKIISLPEDHIVSMFVVIGKALKQANPRPGQLSLDEVIIHDQF